MTQQVVWIKVRDKNPGCYRAEDGFLGPCRAEIRHRYPQAQDDLWEVTMKVDIPGRQPLTRRKTYKRLPLAGFRYDEFKQLATRHLVAHCPTH